MLFHDQCAIYPVGFCSTRVFASMKNPEQQCLYTCQIKDCGAGPQVPQAYGGRTRLLCYYCILTTLWDVWEWLEINLKDENRAEARTHVECRRGAHIFEEEFLLVKIIIIIIYSFSRLSILRANDQIHQVSIETRALSCCSPSLRSSRRRILRTPSWRPPPSCATLICWRPSLLSGTYCRRPSGFKRPHSY